MKVIAFCGPQSNSELMKFLGDNISHKTLVIENEVMLLAREVTNQPESLGLTGYLQHCFGCPETEPDIQPFLESGGLSHAVQLLRYGNSPLDWERFYSYRYGYAYLEHLRDQFEKLGFEHVLINVGMFNTSGENPWHNTVIFQLTNTVFWLGDETAKEIESILPDAKADGYAKRLTEFFFS